MNLTDKGPSPGSRAKVTITDGAEPSAVRTAVPWAPAPVVVSPPDTLGPREIIRLCLVIFRSRWPLGLLAAVVIAAGAGYLLFRHPLEATAQTTLLAQSTFDQILNPTTGSQVELDRQEDALKNHLSMMTSRRFQQTLVASFSPEESAAIQRPYASRRHPQSPELFAGLLAKKIKVDRERERAFFTVTAKHPSPDVAMMMADHFASTYLRFVQNELHGATQKASEVLRKQAGELSETIVALEKESLEYRRKYNLISVEANQDMLNEQLKSLHEALSDVRIKQLQLDAQVARAREDLAQSPLPYSNPTLAAYGHNQTQWQELETLKNQRAIAAGSFGPNHAKMRELDRSVAAEEESLRRNFSLAFEDLRTQAELAANSAGKLEAEIARTFNKSLELNELAGHFNALGQTIESKRKTLDLLLQQLDKTSIDTQLPVDVLRIIDPAYVVYPLIPLKVIYAAIVALCAGAAFFVTTVSLNFFDRTVTASMDLERRFGLRVLGAIPKLGKTRKVERAHVVRDKVVLPYVEAFLTVANQIDLVSLKPFPKRIVVTSALPGEGKSTAASNLAATFTRLGWKTVLVDGDFRRPAQHGMHRTKNDRGLITWAEGGFKPSPDLLSPDGPLGLTVLPDGTSLIPAGGTDVQPSRYLVAPPMTEFFDQLGWKFDVVVVDTPPAGLFQDALILARSCEETVLVVKEGRAAATLVDRIIVDFARTNAPVLGLLLNCFRLAGTDAPFAYGHHGAAAKYYKPKRKLPPLAASA